MKDRLTQRHLATLRERNPSMAEIVDEIFQQADACEKQSEIISANLDTMRIELNELKKTTVEIRENAFVNGDLLLHKTQHQSELNQKDFIREIWLAAVKTVAVTSIGLVLSFVFYSILESIKSELRK